MNASDRVTFRAERAARVAEADRLFRVVMADGGREAERAWSRADRAARAHSWEGVADVMADGYVVGRGADVCDPYDATIDEVARIMVAAGWRHEWTRRGGTEWHRGGEVLDGWYVDDVVPWGDDWHVWGVDNLQAGAR